LTFQADCGSIKGAGVSAEDGTEVNFIFPGGKYATNLIIANVEALSHDVSKSQLQLQLELMGLLSC